MKGKDDVRSGDIRSTLDGNVGQRANKLLIDLGALFVGLLIGWFDPVFHDENVRLFTSKVNIELIADLINEGILNEPGLACRSIADDLNT